MTSPTEHKQITIIYVINYSRFYVNVNSKFLILRNYFYKDLTPARRGSVCGCLVWFLGDIGIYHDTRPPAWEQRNTTTAPAPADPRRGDSRGSPPLVSPVTTLENKKITKNLLTILRNMLYYNYQVDLT